MRRSIVVCVQYVQSVSAITVGPCDSSVCCVCLPQRRGGQRNVACVLFLSAPAAVAVQTSAGAMPVCVCVWFWCVDSGCRLMRSSLCLSLPNAQHNSL